MKLQLIALSLIFSLVGCASPLIKSIYTPTVVKTAVPVQCIKEEDIPVEPDYALSKIVKNDNIDTKVTAALVEIEQRKDWQRLAKAVLKSCASATIK